ncbi:unnamed protein product [Cylicocyclus nassatus]|uniref:RecQ-mediated genome instability protein 1 n=1 Tax=Cylicocyclus nassatus TaxID=53992 RepID=A0AA36GDJ3_CYLNA|nr:unnamed protein product [Cylicocyclus nassatus]
MEAINAAVFDFFAERHIALKQEWLSGVLDFLQSRRIEFDNPLKIAALVFEQWKHADLTDSSYPILQQQVHDNDYSRTYIRHPVVMQINSIVDIGTPYHLQYTTLVYEFVDDTGFEPSAEMERDGRPDICEAKRRRMIMLTVSDGENNLRAIEYHTINSLSLLTKPGCKLLLIPPIQCRKGVLLLKPKSVQIIGGDVASLFATGRPLAVITQKLGITMSILDSSLHTNVHSFHVQSGFQRQTDVLGIGDTSTSSQLMSSEPIPRKDQFPELSALPLRRPRVKPVAQVSPIKIHPSSPIELEESPPNFEAELEMLRTRESVSQTTSNQERNFVTEKRVSILAACGETEITRAKPLAVLQGGYDGSRSSPQNATSKRFHENEVTAPLKKVKVELVTLDDDECDHSQKASPQINTQSFATQRLSQSTQSHQLQQVDEAPSVSKYRALNITRIADATRLMRFAVGSCRKVVQAIILDIVDSLRIVDGLWTMKVTIQDESIDRLACIIDNSSLTSLIGLSPQEAMEIRASSDVDRRKDGQRRLATVESQLKRLDLLLELELFSGGRADPVIRSIRTLVQALDLI